MREYPQLAGYLADLPLLPEVRGDDHHVVGEGSFALPALVLYLCRRTVERVRYVSSP